MGAPQYQEYATPLHGAALDRDWKPQALVPLGYPVDQSESGRRRPLAEGVRYRSGET